MTKVKWLTTQEIADDLGYKSPSTVRGKVRKMIADGTLKGKMFMETYLISEASYIEAKAAGAFDVKPRRVKRGENLKSNS